MNKIVQSRLLEKAAKIIIDVGVGDIILTGRFKNRRTVIKKITKDSYGMPEINGRKAATFRIAPKEKK